MKTKIFDCVEMKHRGAECVMKRLEGKTLAQQLEYWKEGTRKLRERQKKIIAKIT